MRKSSDKKRNLAVGLAAAAAGGAAGYLGMQYGFSKMMLNTDSLFYRVLNRKNPDTALRQFKTQESKKLRERNFAEVFCQSFDGLLLQGHYLHNPSAKKIILFCHGWHGTWDRDAAAGGVNELTKTASLLIVDMRGQGGSGGNMSMGLNEKEDIHAWLDWLQEHNQKKLPIILWGVSMGAATVLMTAGDALPAAVKGMVADCGYTSAYEMAKRFGSLRLHLQNAWMIRRFNRMCMRFYNVDLRRCTTLTAMRRCTRPILFIHGTADDFIPYTMTLDNYNACVSEKFLFLAEGAPHIGSYFTDPKGWKKAVGRFFRKLS